VERNRATAWCIARGDSSCLRCACVRTYGFGFSRLAAPRNVSKVWCALDTKIAYKVFSLRRLCESWADEGHRRPSFLSQMRNMEASCGVLSVKPTS
jgi:hypothetical protein